MISYIYDIAVALIIIICIGSGYKKGILRTVLNIVCLVIAFSLASVFSSYEATEMIYDGYIHEHVMEITVQAVEKAKDEAKQRVLYEAEHWINEAVDENPGGSELLKDFFKDSLEPGGEMLKESIAGIYEYAGVDIQEILTNPIVRDKINDVAEKYSSTLADEINSRMPLGFSVDDEGVKEIITDTEASEAVVYDVFGIKSENSETEGISDYIEKKLIRPAALRTLGIIIWIAVFTVVNTVLRIIISIILVVRKIEPVKACDSLLGGVLGAAGGLAAVIAVCAVVMLITQLTGGFEYMNEDIYADTIVFGRIYDFIAGFIGVGH